MKKLIAILATALCSICLNAQQFGNFEVRNFNLALALNTFPLLTMIQTGTDFH